jgi:hypothetical protein
MDAATHAKLDHETDARFWAITGYQPGKKLDPSNAHDVLMIPVWKAIYDEMLYQYTAGVLQWTYDHPAIAKAIDDATSHIAAVEHALDTANAHPTGTPEQHQALQAAGAHHDAAQLTTKAAGAATPVPQMANAAPAVAHGIMTAQRMAATNPPPVTSTTDVHRSMQLASAPQHAADVAKAHGLAFQMNASGQGVQVAPGATPSPSVSVTPADLPFGPSPTELQPPARAASSWTPLIAFGAVAAALGVGALISNSTKPKRRRGRIGSRGTFELVSRR